MTLTLQWGRCRNHHKLVTLMALLLLFFSISGVKQESGDPLCPHVQLFKKDFLVLFCNILCTVL